MPARVLRELLPSSTRMPRITWYDKGHPMCRTWTQNSKFLIRIQVPTGTWECVPSIRSRTLSLEKAGVGRALGGRTPAPRARRKILKVCKKMLWPEQGLHGSLCMHACTPKLLLSCHESVYPVAFFKYPLMQLMNEKEEGSQYKIKYSTVMSKDHNIKNARDSPSVQWLGLLCSQYRESRFYPWSGI